MLEKYNHCQDILKKSIKKEITEDALEIMTVATLAIYLGSPNLVDLFLPIALRNTVILEGKENIQRIFEQNFEEKGAFDEQARASFFRSYELEEEKEIVTYQNYFLLSTRYSNPVEAILRTCVELLHMIRNGEPRISNGKIRVLNGLNEDIINPETMEIKRKSVALEGAAVELFAEESLKVLKESLEKENFCGSTLLQGFKRKIESYSPDDYQMEKKAIYFLCTCPTFAKALDYSFQSDETPSAFSIAFNNILNSSTAFNRFSKLLDEIHRNGESAREAYLELSSILSQLEIKMHNHSFKKTS